MTCKAASLNPGLGSPETLVLPGTSVILNSFVTALCFFKKAAEKPEAHT